MKNEDSAKGVAAGKDTEPAEDKTVDAASSAKQNGDSKSTNKRKKGPESDQPQKAQRRSGRGAPKSQPSQEHLLNYLLSKDAEELCRPEDETKDMESRGNIRTYSSSPMTPFEELLCAVILSRPISHRLGLRSIRTVLNDPYNFTSAKAVKDAGQEKQHQALWDARTQHKAKTAEQIGQIANVVLEKFTSPGDKGGTQLDKVREQCSKDFDKGSQMLKESIKGLGKTGLDIFFRRVQWLWDSVYPYVDERTTQGLKKLGLPEEGDELQNLLEKHWGELETKHLAGDDEVVRKRRAFVVVLERATGSDLEGKLDAVLEAAAASHD